MPDGQNKHRRKRNKLKFKGNKSYVSWKGIKTESSLWPDWENLSQQKTSYWT